MPAGLFALLGRGVTSHLKAALFAAAVVAASACTATAQVAKRVALVLGNGAYSAAPALDNPVGDAKAVSAKLKRIGFQVVEGYNLGLVEMRTTLAAFAEQLPGAKAALVYYAGHGVAFDDENYLLPIDITLKTPADLDLRSVSLTTVLKTMKQEDMVDVIILDACRNNPFAEQLSRSVKNRALFLDGGLAKVENDLARGTLIAYATDPRRTALDGPPGTHSPFTKALLAHIEDANVPIETMFSRVRADVDRATDKAQTPWVNTSLIGEFDLNPTTATMASTPAAQVASTGGDATVTSAERVALDEKLWAAADTSNTAEDYQAYLDAMPNGAFAQMAKNRMARLNARSPGTAAASPTPAPSPTATPQQAYKTETGSKAGEDALNFTTKDRKDVEARLMALGFDPGDFTGTFTFRTRASISEWQKRRSAPSTGYLGPLQYAELVRETAGLSASLDPAATPAPAPSRAPRKPRRAIAAETPAVAAPPPPVYNYNPAGAFIGGALLGGAIGAAINH